MRNVVATACLIAVGVCACGGPTRTCLGSACGNSPPFGGREPITRPPPAAPTSRRFVVPVQELVVAGPSSHATLGCLPEVAGVAANADTPEVLLLRFATPWGSDVAIQKADLLLTPSNAGALDSEGGDSLEVARVLDPWTAGDGAQQRPPRLSSPVSRFDLSRYPLGTPLRADVTAVVRRWQKGRPDDQGIAVVVFSRSTRGPRYATGVVRGLAPRLDVYLR